MVWSSLVFVVHSTGTGCNTAYVSIPCTLLYTAGKLVYTGIATRSSKSTHDDSIRYCCINSDGPWKHDAEFAGVVHLSV